MKFKVEKMMCQGCVKNVSKKLEALDGINSVRVDLASASAEVEGTLDAQSVINALQAAGYPAQLQSGV